MHENLWPHNKKHLHHNTITPNSNTNFNPRKYQFGKRFAQFAANPLPQHIILCNFVT